MSRSAFLLLSGRIVAGAFVFVLLNTPVSLATGSAAGGETNNIGNPSVVPVLPAPDGHGWID